MFVANEKVFFIVYDYDLDPTNGVIYWNMF